MIHECIKNIFSKIKTNDIPFANLLQAVNIRMHIRY